VTRYTLGTADQLVLVIDDDVELRDLLSRMLHLHGFQVATADNARSALDWLDHTAHLPSLILLDLQMPTADGWDFLAERPRHAAWCSVPVIVVSAEDAEARLASHGVAAMVRKPFRSPRLIAVIESVLRQPSATLLTATAGPAPTAEVDPRDPEPSATAAADGEVTDPGPS
jgi:DNA-binding response OmpR family regulator